MVLHHEENIDATGLHLSNIPPAPHHTPPHSTVNETLQFRWLVKFNPSQNNARFPLLFDNTQVLAYADSGSTRSLVSSALLTRLRGPRATQDLLHKRIKPIDDLNGRPVKILGCTSAQIIIGPKTVQAEFHVFDSMQEIVLLGYVFFHRHKVLLYPGIGLMEATEQAGLGVEAMSTGPATTLHPATEHGFAAIPATQIPASDGKVMFITRNLKEQLIPPCSQMAIQVRVDLSHLHLSDRASIRHLPLTFHSEILQPQTPLHQLQVYYQFTFLDANYHTIIRFSNHTSQHISLAKDQIVAHGQCLDPLQDEEVRQSDDHTAKYIRSVTPPHLVWDAGLATPPTPQAPIHHSGRYQPVLAALGLEEVSSLVGEEGVSRAGKQGVSKPTAGHSSKYGHSIGRARMDQALGWRDHHIIRWRVAVEVAHCCFHQRSTIRD